MPEINNWSINRLLSTAARMLEYSWNDQLKSLGLTHAGVTALGVIAREGMISQVKVASLVGVQAQTMGKTLARLESHGHIFRTRNTIDRRSYLLGITDEGRRVLSEAENIDRKLASVGELSRPEFRGMLINIIEGLTEQGGGEVLKGSTPHQGALGSSYDAADSGEVNLGQGAAEVKRINTAVMDVITPEMIAHYRSQGER
ncbi:MarR family winged helix-turn-helix transcriptional regulator [Rothia endophytica]|uniref:MarR family winged helix-turn-helix transcriptional regulator n=1 Tax=Rothia endophytica TaxID=1324766 RepID=UPI001EFFC530|nr:MarR family transcriptional regulator [Rothia endophytica]